MSNIDYDIKDGIAVIRFNRPEKLNTLTLQMYEDLGNAFIDAAQNPDVAVYVLTGQGEKAFCVGADLTESIPHLAKGHYIDEWDAAHLKHVEMNKPVIAAINGLCMGGGFEIMLGTDIRVASEKAIFALPEVGLGIVPAGGTLTRLARQIPYVHAMELVLSAKKINAQHALEIGLLNYVVKQEDVFETAMTIARSIAELSTNAVQIAKSSMIQLYDMDLEQAFKCESLLGYKAFCGEDAQEGLNSFYEKRKAMFPSRKW